MHRLIILLFIFVFNHAFAQEAGRYVTKSGSYDEDLYIVGEDINIDGTIDGDIVTSGGKIVIDNKVSGDLVAAGGIVKIRADIDDDARLAGGEIIVSGSIGDDLVAGGGNIHLEKSSNIKGRAWLGGAKIDVSGKIGKELKAVGSEVVVRGHVMGDAHIKASHIEILPGAIIEGNLYHESDDEVVISPEASVGGIVEQHVDLDNSWIWKAVGFGLFALFALMMTL